MTKLTLVAAFAVLAPLAAFAQGGPGEHFITNWDLNEDGSVTLTEAIERREMVFDMFDNDQNGTLDTVEYGYFDETRAADMDNNGGGQEVGGHGQGGQRLQVGLTLAFNDTDADGVVSKEEFLAHSGDWIAMVDRNGDSVVNTADFGPQSN